MSSNYCAQVSLIVILILCTGRSFNDIVQRLIEKVNHN